MFLTKEEGPKDCRDADKKRYFLKLPPCLEQKNSAQRCLKVVDEKTPDQRQQLKKVGSSCFVMVLNMSTISIPITSDLKVNF